MPAVIDKILSFIKKYPISILLALIAINLFSIGGSLMTSAKLDKMRINCAKWESNVISSDKAVKEIGVSSNLWDFCKSLDDY